MILPRCFLRFYGSDVYGLVSSITQFLSFINLCDLGVSAVISSAFYKPLANKDDELISKIFKIARRFFRIIGCILIIYIFVLIFVFPKLVSNSFSFTFTVTLLLAMSVSQFGQYFLGITYQILLNSDQKSYIQLIINGGTLIINTIATIAMMYFGGSIQLVKLLTSIIYLFRPLLMYIYVKKNYNIDFSVEVKEDVIPQKWNGVIQHISYMIYENTDIAILTVFSSLSNVSIYSVYILVVNSIKTFINAATTGIQAFFGNMIAQDEYDELISAFDMYDWFIHSACTLLFTISGVLIIPFVMIYTRGVNDANYNVPLFAIFITLAAAVNTVRNCMFVLIRSAGHYKTTQLASMIEAILNLSVSIILVFKYGLVGVAIGTLVATSFFTIFEVIYMSNNILYRPIAKFIKQLLVDIISVLIMVASTYCFTVREFTYICWFRTAVIISVICLIECIIIQYIFFNQNSKKIVNKFFYRFKK